MSKHKTLALLPLLNVVVVAKRQYLRMVKSKMANETDPSKFNNAEVDLSIVLSTKQRISEHSDEFKRLAKFLLHHRDLHLPSSDQEQAGGPSDNEAVKHFELMIQATKSFINVQNELSKMCDFAISVIQAYTSIQQTEKAVSESRSVRYLTVLAVLFVPLSFTASVFGMNFQEFGSGNLSIWIWVVVAVPLTSMVMLPFMSDLRIISLLAVQGFGLRQKVHDRRAT